MFLATCILCLVLISSLSTLTTTTTTTTQQDTFNLTLPHQHPHPEAVVQQLQRRLNVSLSATRRRQMLGIQTQTNDQSSSSSCLTGNPIDDCWRCDPNWAADRQRLADCGIGFGQGALGGKGGQIYTVTDNSDDDPVSPKPGTLRHAVIQAEPLWIVFSGDMLIKLRYELIMNSYKTIDGRGANVHVVGGGCITVQYISNVIIHNIHVHHCLPTGNTNIRSTIRLPRHFLDRGEKMNCVMNILIKNNK